MKPKFVLTARQSEFAPCPTSIQVENSITPSNTQDLKFPGTVTDMKTECWADGICSIKVDEKWVIAEIGGLRSPDSKPEIRGKITGISYGENDIQRHIGKRVEVYAKLIEGNNFTIYGSEDYYIKLLESLPSSIVTSTPVPTQAVDDTAALVAMVKASEVARIGQDANSSTYTVSQIQGNYARGMVSASAGGAGWFAAKVNGTWKLVFIGNGTVQCSQLLNYPDFPNTMIPECWDAVNQKNVTR